MMFTSSSPAPAMPPPAVAGRKRARVEAQPPNAQEHAAVLQLTRVCGFNWSFHSTHGGDATLCTQPARRALVLEYIVAGRRSVADIPFSMIEVSGHGVGTLGSAGGAAGTPIYCALGDSCEGAHTRGASELTCVGSWLGTHVWGELPRARKSTPVRATHAPGCAVRPPGHRD